MASLAPSSNITIIMINIIIMIILWLYFIIFIIEVEPVLQDITGEELKPVDISEQMQEWFM